MAGEWRSVCVALWSPRSCHQLCWDEGSASVHPLKSVFRSVCVGVGDSLKGVSGCSSMIGADPSSESGLRLGDVDFDAVGAFCGRVLSHWRRSLRCHQSFPGFLPLLVHGRVHAPVLPRRKPGLWRLLWHGWWKLLVVVLRTRQKRCNALFILQIEIVVISNIWNEIIAQHMDSSCTLKWRQIFVVIHLKINLSYMDLKLSRWELTKQKSRLILGHK